MSVKINILGIPKVSAFLKLKKTDIKKEANNAMKKVGLHLQNEVKLSIAGHKSEPTSVDTGRFLNSVSFDAKDQGVIIFSDVPYAKNLEFGTSRMRPRRHFQNSLNRNKQKINSILKSGVKK